MYKIENHATDRTITFRVDGFVREAEIRQILEEARPVVDSYKGKAHLVFADMRGMKPADPKVALGIQELILYSRQRGTFGCVHLADSTITRLQAMRIARETNPHDAATVDVSSVEEAHKVLAEMRAKMPTK